MAQLNLYYQTLLETTVSLLPEQIDGDLDEHLLSNLREKIEGKTIDIGIVLKISKLIDYDYGIIDKSNFMGTTVYNVKYECFVCSPTKDLEMICVLDNIIKSYLIGKNGKVIVAVQFNNIDTTRFDIRDNVVTHIKTGVSLKKGSHLKVSVISINNNLGEKNIVTMCKLINIADKNEIRRFNEEQILINNGTIDDDKEFI